jgi:hypothetical protein
MGSTSGYAAKSPRVRVVVVDHNGGEMTLACLARILEVGVADAILEVVLVDNGSRRSVADDVARRWPEVNVVRSSTNRGFAGGNNLALRDLDGVDFVALVNNDVMVSDGWLAPLIAALRADTELGAAGPKLLFDARYRELELRMRGQVAGRGDRRVVGVRWYAVAGARGKPVRAQFVRGFLGPQQDAVGAWFEWTTDNALACVESDARAAGGCRLQLGADTTTSVILRSGDHEQHLQVRPGVHWYDVELAGEPFDLINNAGTVMVDNWYGADRGFLERDRGQYDQPEDVTAWCGGAVLLRADYLRDAGMFDERLFLYYEDLELSLRGAERGWRYRYEPGSTVRHRVGATSVHGSPATERFKERNRLLVLLGHFPLSITLRAAVGFLLSTASYARRDIVAPVLEGRRPRASIVRTRMSAFGGFLRLAPSVLRSRLSDSHQT